MSNLEKEEDTGLEISFALSFRDKSRSQLIVITNGRTVLQMGGPNFTPEEAAILNTVEEAIRKYRKKVKSCQ